MHKTKCLQSIEVFQQGKYLVAYVHKPTPHLCQFFDLKCHELIVIIRKTILKSVFLPVSHVLVTFFSCTLFFYLYTLFSPPSDIQRVGEGHPSACLTHYSKGILLIDYISSSPLSCTFHAISKAVLKQFKQPRGHHSVVWFYLSKGFL